MLKDYPSDFVAFVQENIEIVLERDVHKILIVDYDGSSEEVEIDESYVGYAIRFVIDDERLMTDWSSKDVRDEINKLYEVFKRGGSDAVFSYLAGEVGLILI